MCLIFGHVNVIDDRQHCPARLKTLPRHACQSRQITRHLDHFRQITVTVQDRIAARIQRRQTVFGSAAAGSPAGRHRNRASVVTPAFPSPYYPLETIAEYAALSNV